MTITAEKRRDLIGESIKAIVQLQGMKQDADTEYQISQWKIKLKYLRKKEIDYLEARLEEIKTDIVRCEPGQWAELEGLRSECETTLDRLRKEVQDG
ncbi:MAG: hypothetical protein ACFB2Y_16840 [Fulvivirga sp.]